MGRESEKRVEGGREGMEAGLGREGGGEGEEGDRQGASRGRGRGGRVGQSRAELNMLTRVDAMRLRQARN